MWCFQNWCYKQIKCVINFVRQMISKFQPSSARCKTLNDGIICFMKPDNVQFHGSSPRCKSFAWWTGKSFHLFDKKKLDNYSTSPKFRKILNFVSSVGFDHCCVTDTPQKWLNDAYHLQNFLPNLSMWYFFLRSHPL